MQEDDIMVRINAIHLVGGIRHEHIESMQWINPQTQATGESTRQGMVHFLTQSPGQAFVSDGVRNVTVGVVDATPKYVRTYADGVWTDNLLSLPRY
jgi:hypothetical protein